MKNVLNIYISCHIDEKCVEYIYVMMKNVLNISMKNVLNIYHVI